MTNDPPMPVQSAKQILKDAIASMDAENRELTEKVKTLDLYYRDWCAGNGKGNTLEDLHRLRARIEGRGWRTFLPRQEACIGGVLWGWCAAWKAPQLMVYVENGYGGGNWERAGGIDCYAVTHCMDPIAPNPPAQQEKT